MSSPYTVATVDDLLRPLRIIVGLLAFMLIGVTIAGGILIASLRSDEHAIIAARNESRHTQCLRENNIRHDAGEAAASKARDFINASKAYSGAAPSTGRLKAAEDAYVESQKQATLSAYPLRDCSTKGIDEFYKNPPASSGDERCVPAGKGVCVTTPPPRSNP